MNHYKFPKFCKKVVLLISVLMINSGLLIADNNKSSLEILFIGSSYFNFNDLPNLVNNLASHSGKEIYIDQYIPCGLYLADHASSSMTETKINERNWDYVILQGVGSLMAYPDYYTHHPVYPALVSLKNKILANCASTQIVFCLPWAYEDGMTWVQGWTDTYEDMQIIIYNKTIEYSNSIGFTIAPVGWAWYKVLDDKNYPLHYLHMSDWNHPSLKGSYIMACVIYSTVFQESTNNISYYSDLSSDDAKYFQSVGSNTVLDDLDLWNITTYIDTTYSDTTYTDIPSNNILQSGKSILYQNYPNPFNSKTQIKYYLHKECVVKLEVFDFLGKKYATLINKQQSQGSYSIKFDGSDLNNGIYFFSLKTNNSYQIKKMQLMK